MKNRLNRFLNEESDQPISGTMLLVMGGLAMLWAALASQPDQPTTELGKHLLMFACMVCLLKVFEGRLPRLVWLTSVSLMAFVLVLDVAGRLIS